MNSFYFFCFTFSEDTKINSIYSVNECFELSLHAIICLTFHSHLTDHANNKKTKQRLERVVSNVKIQLERL